MKPTLTERKSIGDNDKKFGDAVSLIQQWLDEAAVEHTSGRIQVEFILRGGRIVRVEAIPLAQVFQ